jgi:uncharacterized membrane protein YGL010W
MKTLTERLAQYAAYHRDRRNIATHFVGIPMITFSVIALLARPHGQLGGLTLSPAAALIVATTIFYLRLDLRYGLTMLLLTSLSLWGATALAAQATSVWLATSLGLFVAGWVIQFVGHYFEGKKPAFIDDLAGLLLGPLFVVAEAGFALGLRRSVNRAIEDKVGPTLIRVRGAASPGQARRQDERATT